MRYKPERALTHDGNFIAKLLELIVEMRYKPERALTRHWAASSLIKE